MGKNLRTIPVKCHHLYLIRNERTLEIPYNEKLEHRRPLCIERERDPLHILLVAMRCYAHYMIIYNIYDMII